MAPAQLPEPPPSATPPPAAPLSTDGPTHEASLEEQVRSAIATYALGEGHLQRVFDEHGLPWKGEELGRKLVDAAARQIYASVEARGETSYSLVLPNGRPNSGRVAAVAKYLEKVVAKRADARKQSKR